MTRTLYELTGNWNNLYDLVENDEVEFEVIEEGLREIETDISTKFENISGFIKSLEGEVETFKTEEKRIAARRKTKENKIRDMKNYMLEQLMVMDQTKINANTFTIRRQANPPSADVYDPKQLADTYLIPQPPKADTKQILADLKAKKEVEGAALKPKSYHLRIQ